MADFTLHAATALLPGGWTRDVAVRVAKGRIVAITPGAAPAGADVPCLLPAPANLHSHTFQRAMAGMTETRQPGVQDSFWTWRALMYRFLDHLTPEDVEAIAALAMLEMAEAGFAAVAEFHYLHHQPGGRPYADLAEMSGRIVAAAQATGLGLTLLPVLYERGGCDGRALGPGQARFGNDPGRFADLWQGAAQAMRTLPPDAVLGVAPHSLRAVSQAGLRAAEALSPDAPLHIHLAEQVAEVDEVLAYTGARPVEWLLAQAGVGPRWCPVHCTQMQPHETAALARSGAVAGLCPITEANLGDGIFDGGGWQAAAGAFGVGSDSNLRISLTGELRLLEYSQRLARRGRALLATPDRSTGRVLWETAARGGAQAAGRGSGAIRVGDWADLAVPEWSLDMEGCEGDAILDALIFAGGTGRMRDLWSAGRHIVQNGRHIARDAVTDRYRRTMTSLRARL